MGTMERVVGRTRYPVEYVELERFDEVEFDSYVVHVFPNDHRLPGVGYALAEDDRPGRFDPEEARGWACSPVLTSGGCRRGRRSTASARSR